MTIHIQRQTATEKETQQMMEELESFIGGADKGQFHIDLLLKNG